MITTLATCVMCGHAGLHLDEEGDPGPCPDFRIRNDGARIPREDSPRLWSIPSESARWPGCD